MSIKINSFGGILIWCLRKRNSAFTSKVALEFTSKKYKPLIERYIQKFNASEKKPLFRMVNIETVNRCNGMCSFCPANVWEEKRDLKRMSQSLFEKIVHELEQLKWEGQIFLNVNNEPFLDKEILKRAKFIKEKLGDKAIVSMFTNGTLLSIDKLDALSESVDILVINNYSKKYCLNTKIKEIYNYVKNNPKKFRNIDITINRRYSEEILATRAGNAPNKKKKNNKVESPCIYPYTDITIFPDGKVGLCCNDCYEITDYGSVAEESLINIWENEKFEKVRTLMGVGRHNFPFCKECDVVDTGFREKLIGNTVKGI